MLIHSFVDASDDILATAYESYTAGERAETFADRSAAFNEALLLYSEAEKKYPSYGKLYYNIGNCYFHLGEYPHAIVYYNKALKLLPREKKIRHHLALSLKKAGVAPENPRYITTTLLFFHKVFSFKERSVLFTIFTVAATALWSLFLWQRRRRIKLIALWFTALAAILFLSAMTSITTAHSRGIVIDPTVLRCDAGDHYKSVTAKPLLAGITVKILDATDKAPWIKIATPSGDIGYISIELVEIM